MRLHAPAPCRDAGVRTRPQRLAARPPCVRRRPLPRRPRAQARLPQADPGSPRQLRQDLRGHARARFGQAARPLPQDHRRARRGAGEQHGFDLSRGGRRLRASCGRMPRQPRRAPALAAHGRSVRHDAGHARERRRVGEPRTRTRPPDVRLRRSARGAPRRADLRAGCGPRPDEPVLPESLPRAVRPGGNGAHARVRLRRRRARGPLRPRHPRAGARAVSRGTAIRAFAPAG